MTTYIYDYAADGDRLRKVSYPDERWVEYFYDDLGRRVRMTDSAGGDTRYIFDSAGRLSQLLDASNNPIVEYSYDATGNLTRTNKANKTYTTYDYDAAGQILHLINHAGDDSVNTRFDYIYDARGHRLTMGTIDGNWAYDYDSTGQLIHAVFTSTNPEISDHDLRYAYDTLGNRISTVINGVTTDYVANDRNQYASVGGVAQMYDADGNLVNDGVDTYTYDDGNRLIRMAGPDGVTEYEYDAFGSRTALIRNGEREAYLLEPSGLVNVLAEINTTRTSRNVYGHGLELRYESVRAESFFELAAQFFFCKSG